MKTARILLGTLGGGVITALCVAIVSWIVIFNSDPGFGVEGPHPEWAVFAATLGGMMGSILGLPLGFVIGLVNRGPVLGSFFGLLMGLMLVLWAYQTGGHPDIVYPTVPLLISFLPAGALSGLSTSLVVSRVLQADFGER